MMNQSASKFWVMFLLLAVWAYGALSVARNWRRETASSAKSSSPTAQAEDVVPTGNKSVGWQIKPFKLIDQDGREFDSQELQGKVWVASFFFASCPGACLKMNNTLAALQQELAEVDVRFVSVTVDIEDTPEALKRSAAHYRADPARWLFLTGPEKELERLATEQFKVSFGKGTHSDRFFVVGKDGKVVAAYRTAEDGQLTLLKQRVRKLNADQPPAAKS